MSLRVIPEEFSDTECWTCVLVCVCGSERTVRVTQAVSDLAIGMDWQGIMVQVFRGLGWRIEPTVCPECRREGGDVDTIRQTG